jgi:tetratricopeptide (TPR) repeat protein
LRTALLPSGDWGRSLAALREAESLAAALDDSRRLGQVSRLLAIHFWFRGAYNQALATAQRVLALAMASGDVVLQALTNQTLGMTYQIQGDYRQAIDCYGQTVASLDEARRHERLGNVVLPAVQSRAHLAWCHAELGTFAEGRAFGEEGLRIAEAVAHLGSLMLASWGIGLLSLRQGRPAQGAPPARTRCGPLAGRGPPSLFPLDSYGLGRGVHSGRAYR